LKYLLSGRFIIRLLMHTTREEREAKKSLLNRDILVEEADFPFPLLSSSRTRCGSAGIGT
jgi:hypothetical protein